jgi:hypothetical protein
MATIVLTAFGTLFGGPIGGAIGAALGQRVDQAIIGGGKGREGPRLKELDVQTSSYGTQIPAIFGAMRVAGTVIWSTDLIERRVKSGGGKGRPSTVNYSYSASFAVALSSRPVARIGRIWADGNLLRGAAGDFKTETGFRFHSGHGDQPHDPLLASAEASGQCPAHRGLAYVVFEELQLADFGNRIPSLTFEIFERELPVAASEIAAVASGGLITGESPAALSGYALQGGDCRMAIEPLIASLPVFVRPVGNRLEMARWSATADVISDADAVIRDGVQAMAAPEQIRGSNSKAPNIVSIRHYDPERDFQAGVQSSRRIGTGRRETQIDLPAAVNATEARRLSDLQLLQQWRGLNGSTLNFARNGQQILLGQKLPGSLSRIVEVEHFRGASRVVAAEWIEQALQNTVADSGRNQTETDFAVSPTQLMVLELPAMDAIDPARPVVAIAAAGMGPGWRRASLVIRDGDRAIDIGGTVGVANMGALLDALPAHNPLLPDRGNQPIIRLAHHAMSLPPGTGDADSFDSPMLWLGGEIIRYGRAEKIGLRDYRLSGLIRGCFGTGDIWPSHLAGTSCLLLEAESLRILDSIPTPVGANISVEALGLGDVQPVTAALAVVGLAILPPSPVHGRAEWRNGGDLWLVWVRRDRLAYAWLDGADIPNSEGGSDYHVTLSVGQSPLGEWTVSANELLISAAELAGFSIAPGAMLTFSVVQQGRYAQSRPLTLSHQY